MKRITGTPSSFSSVAQPETLEQLEFARALEVVARHARSPLGADRVRARRPVAGQGWVEEELATVGELAGLLAAGDPFASADIPDIDEALDQLQVEGAVLGSDALYRVGTALEVMQTVGGELRRLLPEARRVAALSVELPAASLGVAILRAISPDGAVRDEASPALARARRHVREARALLVSALERVLQSAPREAVPPQATVTVRSGRYVIPVRRDARARFPGIVHAESGTGSSLFVEPAAAVELGNGLAEREAEEARAVLAVLRALTESLRPVREALAAGWTMCIRVDDLYARARYMVEQRATVPRVVPAPGALAIHDGRHPLLLVESSHVVPFDLSLDRSEVTVVISGPNTGGKTVLLKAIGLVSALVQSGIVPPVGEGTVMPIFARIFSDIGDHQSIAESLSTFSARLGALKGILTDADDRTLILIDELGSGTDPNEGAALAGAVLHSLAQRRATTIATTHLGQLKVIAADAPGFVNASLRFNEAQMTPTYELLKGVPGRSYGIQIARRLGVPAEVIERAEAGMPDRDRSVDALLTDLEQRAANVRRRQADLDFAEAQARADQELLDTREGELADRDGELRARERELERGAREDARRFLLAARKRVEEALGLARAAVDEATAKEARRLVEEGVREESAAVQKLKREGGAKGWRIKGTGREVGVPESPAAAEGEPGGRGRWEAKPVYSVDAASEIDVRGMSGEETEGAVLAALDDAVVADLPSLRVIHGKGTGALRERVGKLLKGDRRVRSAQLAPVNQGGSGVTIAVLRP